MMICYRQQALLSFCAAKCREFWLIAACILAPLSLAVSDPALAQCTGPASNTSCSPGGNPYATGINPSTTDIPMNLALQSGVQVIANGTVVNAVSAFNTTVTPRSRARSVLRSP